VAQIVVFPASPAWVANNGDWLTMPPRVYAIVAGGGARGSIPY
jgi:hypothetical protein